MNDSLKSTPLPAARISQRPPCGRPLIVRIRNWVGDVVLGLPGLRMIEDAGYDLIIVARGKWAPALLVAYGWPVHLQPAKFSDKVRQLRELRRQCRAIDPDFDHRENALVMPESFSSALEMKLAGLRGVGYAKEGRTPLLARAFPIVFGGHALISYWKLACYFLRVTRDPPALVDLAVHPSKAAEARRILAVHGVDGDYLLICPFAAGLATKRKLNKIWPEFREFVKLASHQLDLPLVVYPGPGEQAQALELYPSARMIDGCDLAVYAGLLQHATLVVANDTGPAHMAAAMGQRLISVLGPTIAVEWAPWGPNVEVLQHPQPIDPAAPNVWPSASEVLERARAHVAATRDIPRN